MKKKALLISLISLLVVGALILLIPNLIRKKPKGYEPADIENSMLIPQKIVYNYEGEIPDTFIEPNYFVKNGVLSYSLVGQMPLNEFNYTDLGALYETELNTSNFDDFFKNGGAWAKGFDAKYLRENCIAALRADITEGVMLTEIPLGERFYYILLVKDEIYICLYSNGEMLQVLEADIKNEEINSSFSAVVVNKNDTNIIVEHNGERIIVDTNFLFYQETLPELDIGDTVEIVYNGTISTNSLGENYIIKVFKIIKK